MSFLVSSGTAGHVPEKPRKFFFVRKWFKLNKIKFITRSKLPGNNAKFDITQITLRSELLSQLRGSVIVLRDRIHKVLGNLINLIRIDKLVCFNVLNVKLQVCEKVIARLIDCGFCN